MTLDLLRDAARWRLRGLLFERPDEAWRARVAAVMEEVDDADLRAAAAGALEQASEGLYHSIFGPGGPAPPREVSYTATLQPGLLLAELTAYYEAFGYRPETEEPPDHVAVEIGFLAFLRLKEAYALTGGDTEHAEVTADAARRFLAEHLAPTLKGLSAALATSGIPYLSKLGTEPNLSR